MLVGFVVVSAITIFALPHIAATNANPIDAIAASWNVFKRNPWKFILAEHVFTFILMSGVLACGVGVLVTMPLYFAILSKAYADHFGIDGWNLH